MSESKTPKAGGLWARLFGMHEATEEKDGTTRSQESPQPTSPEVIPVPGPAAEVEPVLLTPVEPPARNGSAEAIETPTSSVEPTLTVVEETPTTPMEAPSAPEVIPSVVEESPEPVEAKAPEFRVASAPVVDAVPESNNPTITDTHDLPPVEAAPPFVETPLSMEEPSTWDEMHPAPVPVAPPPVAATSVAVVEPVPEKPALVEIHPAPAVCLACGAARQVGLTYCADCGWMFPEPGAAATSSDMASVPSLRESDMPASSNMPLQNRFELGGLIIERQGVRRHRGIDLTTGQNVVIVAEPLAELDLPVGENTPVAAMVEEDIVPGFDEEILVATAAGSAWPSVAWEKNLLEQANHPVLPAILDHFTHANTEYLVLAIPVGVSLWDAWDEPDADASVRYDWLQKIAGAIAALHKAGATYEGIRPDVIVIGEDRVPRFTELRDVLPLPLPANPPLRATLYTAPELILSPATADGRADLYSFGAMLYSLEYLHHPLEEKDFERQFTPKQITDRFPDVHPMFLRLINKTFTRDIDTRFPTDEMTKTDPTGFKELIKTLDICRRNFDNVRLDIAAWTTTGMVRTGNEDAFTVLHGADARLDDLHEYAMVILCDGMGGYEAGEVAADMAINEMRKFLLQQPIFAALTGKEGPKDPVDAKKYQEVLKEALRQANRHIYTFSRAPGKAKRMMGCTAECVYVDSRNVIAGHVGDSRVYHLHKGRLIQLTRDQTLVGRLVELGQLTAEEAENHPRKNELQQAIGGQPDVMPGLYHGKLQRGDWVMVCSDGLTNHITNAELEKMLTREAANSAEEAARRLLNLVNLRGATDNATVVMVRAS